MVPPNSLSCERVAMIRSHSLILNLLALITSLLPWAKAKATETTGITSGHWLASTIVAVKFSPVTLIPSLTTEILAPMASRNSKVALSPCNESKFKSFKTTSLPIAPATR